MLSFNIFSFFRLFANRFSVPLSGNYLYVLIIEKIYPFCLTNCVCVQNVIFWFNLFYIGSEQVLRTHKSFWMINFWVSTGYQKYIPYNQYVRILFNQHKKEIFCKMIVFNKCLSTRTHYRELI